MDTTSRFADYKTPRASVLLVGAGTIGSYTALALTKAGFSLCIYDPDKVEAGNVGVQLYGVGHLKKAKTDALYSSLIGSLPEYGASLTLVLARTHDDFVTLSDLRHLPCPLDG